MFDKHIPNVVTNTIWCKNLRQTVSLILLINFSNMDKRYIMQYSWKSWRNIPCPIRLQWFDFEVNSEANKWANIFKIASKLPWLKWMVSVSLLYKYLIDIAHQTFLWKVNIKLISKSFIVITAWLCLGYFFWRYVCFLFRVKRSYRVRQGR